MNLMKTVFLRDCDGATQVLIHRDPKLQRGKEIKHFNYYKRGRHEMCPYVLKPSAMGTSRRKMSESLILLPIEKAP